MSNTPVGISNVVSAALDARFLRPNFWLSILDSGRAIVSTDIVTQAESGGKAPITLTLWWFQKETGFTIPNDLTAVTLDQWAGANSGNAIIRALAIVDRGRTVELPIDFTPAPDTVLVVAGYITHED